ncbi:MAG: pirin family protein [Actinobacteria bacterium]|nr:pirin family protein [Actinomycetota bacterium]
MNYRPIIKELVPLGTPWATIDPFLFCVHHRDAYPAGDGHGGPSSSLAGRNLGNDFADVDGWNMYHGSAVPGFPQHPHRGFETLTYVRQGLVDHADSLGASARYGEGDAQWMTAGSGIVHSEMFPLLDESGGNQLELFQIWINLAAADKMVEPHFSMLWANDIPVIDIADEKGRATRVTLVAGAVDGHVLPDAPPDSWAAKPESDVAVWHVVLDAGASWAMPLANHGDTQRMVYLFEGDSVSVGGEQIRGYTGALIRCDEEFDVVADGGPVEMLVLQGRPIGEPVERYGPFVMNTRAEIQEAFDDYRTTAFGGWPWPDDGPVHGQLGDRFVKRPDKPVEVGSA